MKHTPHSTPSDKDEDFLSIVETLPLALGDDEPFEPSTNLIEYLRRTGAWDDVDMVDLMYRLGKEFGLSFSNEEVAEFFNPSTGGAPRTNEEWEREVASKLTFADLANFIQIRMKPISFEPVSVLGLPPDPNGLKSSKQDNDVVVQAILKSFGDLGSSKLRNLGPDSDLVELVQKYDVFESLDFEEFIWRLEERLNIQLTHEALQDFFGPMWERVHETNHADQHIERSQFTVAALADFIRGHLKPISFEPVSMLGSPPCPAAGYFVGMSELVQHVRPEAERFGPSTPITQVLPSHSLSIFWRRLSRAAGRSLPELSFWLNHLANVLLIASAACLAFGVLVNWAFLAAVWLLCLKGIQFGWWLHRRANPLPQGIVTFGDLARHLAGQKEIPAPRTLSRRVGGWVGRTFLRRRPAEASSLARTETSIERTT